MREAADRWSNIVNSMRERIWFDPFKFRHRGKDTDFTRDRLLTFPVVVLWLLQKTTRSIQRHAHSFLRQLYGGAGAPTVTPGGWTQARAKFRHTAFIELNQEVILPGVYSEKHAKDISRWKGHRVLGMDSSNLRLPAHPEIEKEFGITQAVNQLGETGHTYTLARLSVLYDLLNDLGLDAALAPQSVGERELVLTQIGHIHSGDVVICDRGLSGYPLMATLRAKGAHFVGRCSQNTFFAAKELFRLNRAGRSQIVKITAHDQQRPKLRDMGLPFEMVVRFVSLRLPSGDLEVLVTSLLDESCYPTEEFLEVYHWRWEHETYHQMLKGRLDLENWTGQTLEAVRQDLHATVLLSNIESLLSQEVQEELTKESTPGTNPVQVNRAVSYHAIKERLLDLLFNKNSPVDQTIAEIQTWMRANPVVVRKRKVPRQPQSVHRSYQFQRNVRKAVF